MSDYNRIISLGMDGGLNDEGERCPDCGETTELMTCEKCGNSGHIINCGHFAQPRPIAGDDGHSICCECADDQSENGIESLDGLLEKLNTTQQAIDDKISDGEDIHGDYEYDKAGFDLCQLPLFGGEHPKHTEGIYSYDEDNFLMYDSSRKWHLVPREESV